MKVIFGKVPELAADWDPLGNVGSLILGFHGPRACLGDGYCVTNACERMLAGA